MFTTLQHRASTDPEVNRTRLSQINTELPEKITFRKTTALSKSNGVGAHRN